MENHGAKYETRFKLLRERVLAMKELWTKEEAQFHGEFVNFDPVWLYPKPRQRPHPPCCSAAKAIIPLKRVVEFCDGWFPRPRGGWEPKSAVERLAQGGRRSWTRSQDACRLRYSRRQPTGEACSVPRGRHRSRAARRARRQPRRDPEGARRLCGGGQGLRRGGAGPAWEACMDDLVLGVPDLGQGIDLVERRRACGRVRRRSIGSRHAQRAALGRRTGSTSRSSRSIPSSPQRRPR